MGIIAVSAIPNFVAVRDFATEKFGWSKIKIDEMVKPVIKKMSGPYQVTMVVYKRLSNRAGQFFFSSHGSRVGVNIDQNELLGLGPRSFASKLMLHAELKVYYSKLVL